MAIVPYSGFYGPNAGDYALVDANMPTRTRISRVVNRDGFRQFRALFNSLIGGTAGGTAFAQHTRVQHTQGGNSVGGVSSDLGKPQITTVTDINRTTTAADIAALKALVVNVTERPVPYPVDRSGNGGPALS